MVLDGVHGLQPTPPMTMTSRTVTPPATRLRARYALLAWGLLALLTAPSAVAHSAFNYYSTGWGPSDVPTINWRFTAEVPSGAFRDRVEDGAAAWTNVPGVSFSWVKQTPQYANYAPNPTQCTSIPADKNGVHFRAVPSAFDGYTHTCVSGSFLLHIQVVFDDTETWFTGTASPPSPQLDVWAFASHEFGHGTGGWLSDSIGGHFDGQTLCPSNSSKHTMCATISAGQTWQRSLAFHDEETFGNAY